MVRVSRLALLPVLLLEVLFVAGCATPPQQHEPDPYEAALRQYWDGRMATSRALVAIQQLAETGDPRAEFWLGLEYLEGRTVRQNDTEGIKWLLRAASHDNTDAQMKLAYIYHYGQHGLAKDPAESEKWFSRAQALGDPSHSSSLYDPADGGQYTHGEAGGDAPP